MSSDSKRIKICTLVSLIYGIVAAIMGIVFAVTTKDATSWPVVGTGVLSAVVGVRGALIANVPSTIAKLVKLAVIVFIVQVVVALLALFLVGPQNVNDYVLPFSLMLVSMIVTLIIAILSQQLNRKNLAK